MAFIETPRFPDDLAAWADGGAMYNTDLVVVSSGYEQRNITWAQSRGRWDISNGLRTRANEQAAIAFFRAMKGRGHGFRFRDVNDYQATVAEGAFDTTAVTNVWQMVKVYAAGSLNERRLIQKPLAAGFAMYKSGVLMTVGGGTDQYTIDTTTGKVTLGGTPIAITNYAWSGNFDVPCRFDTDQMRGHREPQGGFYEWGEIPIVEIRI